MFFLARGRGLCLLARGRVLCLLARGRPLALPEANGRGRPILCHGAASAAGGAQRCLKLVPTSRQGPPRFAWRMVTGSPSCVGGRRRPPGVLGVLSSCEGPAPRAPRGEGRGRPILFHGAASAAGGAQRCLTLVSYKRPGPSRFPWRMGAGSPSCVGGRCWPPGVLGVLSSCEGPAPRAPRGEGRGRPILFHGAASAAGGAQRCLTLVSYKRPGPSRFPWRMGAGSPSCVGGRCWPPGVLGVLSSCEGPAPRAPRGEGRGRPILCHGAASAARGAGRFPTLVLTSYRGPEGPWFVVRGLAQ